MTKHDKEPIGRRQMLMRLGLAAGAAYLAPSLTSHGAARASGASGGSAGGSGASRGGGASRGSRASGTSRASGASRTSRASRPGRRRIRADGPALTPGLLRRAFGV